MIGNGSRCDWLLTVVPIPLWCEPSRPKSPPSRTERGKGGATEKLGTDHYRLPSDAYRQLAGDRHGREPLEFVRLFPTHNSEELALQSPRDWSNCSIANRDAIYRSDRSDFGRRPGKECLICDVEHFPRNARFDNWNP